MIFYKISIKKRFMKLPFGKINKNQIDAFSEESIEYHLDMIYKVIEEYDMENLYENWRILIRSIDELINIPLELDDPKEIEDYLSLSLGCIDVINKEHLVHVLNILEKRFDVEVKNRFLNLSLMVRAVSLAYRINNAIDIFGYGINLSDVRNALVYFQSRRVYYNAVLSLIPFVSKGEKVVPFIDLLDQLHYPIESCLVGVTTSYYNLLVNNSLDDFEMESDGDKVFGNFPYTVLEGFFMEPQRLSLLDQLELRPDIVLQKKMLEKSTNKIFSFVEIANTMASFEGAFNKYQIKYTKEYNELSYLCHEIAIYFLDDFNIKIDKSIFVELVKKFSSLKLVSESSNYFVLLNGFFPFQNCGNAYYSTVQLLSRFVYQTLSLSLLKQKSFQINSGFLFEDKSAQILEEHGFKCTGVKRINRKEFDLIAIKDDVVYNFQCKNNLIDVSRVDNNYKKIGRLNKTLCRYYEKSLQKEKDREGLIMKNTGYDKVEHFIISRYPVISRNNRIINYKDLDHRLNAQF